MIDLAGSEETVIDLTGCDKPLPEDTDPPIVSRFKIEIRNRDLESLAPEGHLNDMVRKCPLAILHPADSPTIVTASCSHVLTDNRNVPKTH